MKIKNNKITITEKVVAAKLKNNKQNLQQEKQKYFEYYDDVKHFSKGKEQW